jgi:hypothetical protein
VMSEVRFTEWIFNFSDQSVKISVMEMEKKILDFWAAWGLNQGSLGSKSTTKAKYPRY